MNISRFSVTLFSISLLSLFLSKSVIAQTNDCTNPTSLTVNASAVNGTTSGATQTINAVTCFYTGNADDDVFYQFTTSVAGYYTVFVTGLGNMDAVIDVRTGTCPGSTLACADATGTGGSETATFNAMANTTYFIRIYDYYDIGYNTNASNFNIRVASQNPIITTHPVSQSTCINTGISYTVGASSYASQTYQWQRSPDNVTWYTITNNNPTGVTYTGTTTNTLSIIGTAAVSNYYYRCAVTAGGNQTVSNVATLAIELAPAITSNPINNTMFTGNSINMSVTATGANLSYQWQYNNGGTWASVSNGTPASAVYTNANTNILNIAGISATGNYQYRCVVSGNCNPAATSGSATLTVYQSSADNWNSKGNAGSDPNVNFMGTTDNVDLVTKTNNTEAMRVKANGNVGINNNNPAEKLDVTGNAKVSGTTITNNLKITNGASEGAILTSDANGNASWTPQANTISALAWTVDGNNGTDASVDFVGTKDQQDFNIKTNNQLQATFEYGINGTKEKQIKLFDQNDFPYVYFNGSNGRIGLGDSPEDHNCYDALPERLFVKGAVKMHANTGNATLDEKCIIIGHDGGNGIIDLHNDGSGVNAGNLLLGWYSGYNVSIIPQAGLTSPSGSSSLYVHGKLGVGADAINSPYKVNIDGSINATEFYRDGSLLKTSQWINGTTNILDINYTLGNVGIGSATEDPLYGNISDIYGPKGNLLVKNTLLLTGSNSNTAGIMFRNAITNGNQTLNYNGDIGIEMIDDPTSSDYSGQPIKGLNFWTPCSLGQGASGLNNYMFFISTDLNRAGNIGIGTARPDSKLSIRNLGYRNRSFSINDGTSDNFLVYNTGEVFARSYIATLQNPFPDYVFEKSYKLMELKELESFISQNNHLPNIPSAKYFNQNGVDICELQRLQMEKVEELTLYIIQLQKQIDNINLQLRDKNEK